MGKIIVILTRIFADTTHQEEALLNNSGNIAKYIGWNEKVVQSYGSYNDHDEDRNQLIDMIIQSSNPAVLVIRGRLPQRNRENQLQHLKVTTSILEKLHETRSADTAVICHPGRGESLSMVAQSLRILAKIQNVGYYSVGSDIGTNFNKISEHCATICQSHDLSDFTRNCDNLYNFILASIIRNMKLEIDKINLWTNHKIIRAIRTQLFSNTQFDNVIEELKEKIISIFDNTKVFNTTTDCRSISAICSHHLIVDAKDVQINYNKLKEHFGVEYLCDQSWRNQENSALLNAFRFIDGISGNTREQISSNFEKWIKELDSLKEKLGRYINIEAEAYESGAKRDVS